MKDKTRGKMRDEQQQRQEMREDMTGHVWNKSNKTRERRRKQGTFGIMAFVFPSNYSA